MTNRYDVFRDQIADAHGRFHGAMLQVLYAHTDTVAAVGELLCTLGEHEAQLEESIDELKLLLMDHGEELRALRDRLNGREGA